jgi:hypothetical protein
MSSHIKHNEIITPPNITLPIFACSVWRKTTKTSVRIAGLQAKMWTQEPRWVQSNNANLLNTALGWQECVFKDTIKYLNKIFREGKVFCSQHGKDWCIQRKRPLHGRGTDQWQKVNSALQSWAFPGLVKRAVRKCAYIHVFTLFKDTDHSNFKSYSETQVVPHFRSV